MCLRNFPIERDLAWLHETTMKPKILISDDSHRTPGIVIIHGSLRCAPAGEQKVCLARLPPKPSFEQTPYHRALAEGRGRGTGSPELPAAPAQSRSTDCLNYIKSCRIFSGSSRSMRAVQLA